MLGSIEELEKDIELFQQNVAASSELQMLLKKMLEQIKQQNSEFGIQSSALISRVDNLPYTIENANISSNNRVKNDIAAEVDRALQSFANEQSRYLQALKDVEQKIQTLADQAEQQGKMYADGVASTLDKFDESAKKIVEDNIRVNNVLKADIDKLLAERNAAFSESQGKYIVSLQQTQNEIKNCESQLTTKYFEFIDTLQKTNISNLYNQNKQLKDELNKRTTILMGISVISIIVGVISFFI
ncbi:hypothetical protein [Sporofaciens sp. SGI.106]|uniref:hypothetical protein n=1 Tax=Sporofaciens sp. SGI.106 TaxID=3420568 RepID=UPI003D064E14